MQMGLLFLLAFAVLSLPGVAGPLGIRAAHAITIHTVSGSLDSTLCTTNGGSWSLVPSSTCTLSSGVEWEVATSTTLTIPSGINLVVSGGSGINNDGTIDNAGGINIQEFFGNSGTIDNSGGILSQDIFYNYGTINNPGYLENRWDFENRGGTIDNSGTIENTGTGSGIGSDFWNDGTITNYGTIDNQATFENDGTIDNYGTISNPHAFYIEGNPIINECGGILYGSYPAGGYTQVACPPGVPEFSTFGPFLLTALVFPALLIATRRFRRTSV